LLLKHHVTTQNLNCSVTKTEVISLNTCCIKDGFNGHQTTPFVPDLFR